MKKNISFQNYKIKPAFSDKRGKIFDIVEDRVSHVGMVTFKKGVSRGNHYHKKSVQYSYVLEGRIKFTISNVDGSNKKSCILSPGTLTAIPPKMVHTYTALTEALMLDITTLGRNDNGYEKDTVRV